MFQTFTLCTWMLMGIDKVSDIHVYTCAHTHTLCRQQFSDPVFYVFQSGLSHEELSVAVEMLSAVAVLNEVLDTKDPQAVIEQLTDSPLGFTNIDQDNLNR